MSGRRNHRRISCRPQRTGILDHLFQSGLQDGLASHVDYFALYYGNGIVCSDQCSGKTSVEKVLNMAIEDCRLKLQTQAAVSLPT